MPSPITIGLSGNPNSGKTTLFNELTGARQHVGNYPGVTVEKKEGQCHHDGVEIHVVDLPGTYSLTAWSMEELVARNFVVDEHPDVIVNVVDASNLERNLYLTTQFIELEQPTVIALNMMDVAIHRGSHIDTKLLSELLGVPVVPMSASRRQGLSELLDTVVEVARAHQKPTNRMFFGTELEEHISSLTNFVAPVAQELGLLERWVAIKLLEADPEVRRQVEEASADTTNLLAEADRIRNHLALIVGDDAEIAIADRRYGYAAGAVRESLRSTHHHRVDWSEAVDRIVCSRLLGLPIFVLLMWLMFEFVFTVGTPGMQAIEWLFASLGSLVQDLLPPGDLQSLIVDGVISGVGGVLIFLPNIMLLFLAISILEDTGYMSRAAFVVDRIMHRIGLHGKSFIPMLIGFGCTVPAVMATRTLDERRDRLVTMLVVPLMSCGARLPVYILLAGAFFSPMMAGKIIFGIYMFGVVMAMLMALLFRRVLFTGATTPFVMELPPYRLPTLRGIAIHMWERAWQYIKKAGTVLLAFSIVIWALMKFPTMPPEKLSQLPEEARLGAELEYSYAGRIGKSIEPVIKPLGFDWRIGVALTAGFGAKEVVVSTLGTIYSISDAEEDATDLRAAIRADHVFSPLIAIGLMVFVLLYVPCLSTVIVIWRESGQLRWPLFTVFYTCSLAWICSFIVYHVGKFMGFG